MLSYRHGFHAGNSADILKHVTLALIIDYLKKKPSPIRYIDTHAGAGVYNIEGSMAVRTGEFQRGVGCLDLVGLASVQGNELSGYISAVNSYMSHQHYPGSPALAAKLLRTQDEIRLFELHTSEFPLLLKSFGRDRRIKLFNEDGYQSMKALLPVKNARALILIDPSYENNKEYSRVVDAFKQGYMRMPTAVFAIWYPVVEREALEAMIRKISATVPSGLSQFELTVDCDTGSSAMTTSGMLVANAPWTLKRSLDNLFQLICQQLESGNPDNTRASFVSREIK